MIMRPSRRDMLRYGICSGRGSVLAGTGHRPGLAQQADQDHLRLSGRRADRHLRARLRRGHLADDRPAGGGREQGRRLGRHRRRAGQERARRRPHADVDDLDDDDHEQGAVQEAALRSRQGLRADLVDGCRPPADHPAQERAGAGTCKEFADYARNNKVSLGTYGAGSYSHVAVEALNRHFGLTMEAVHYRGEAPMWVDVGSGAIQGGSGSYAAASSVLQTRQRPGDRGADQGRA